MTGALKTLCLIIRIMPDYLRSAFFRSCDGAAESGDGGENGDSGNVTGLSGGGRSGRSGGG